MMKHSYIVLIAAAALPFMMQGQAKAETVIAKNSSKQSLNFYKDHADSVCRDVVPAWIKSKTGTRDKAVRRLSSECYLKQMRLGVLDRPSNTLDPAVSIEEVPLSLLEKLTGFRFETYAPLAGAEIRIREPKRRDNE